MLLPHLREHSEAQLKVTSLDSEAESSKKGSATLTQPSSREL